MLYISDWDLGEIIEVTTSSGEQKTVMSGLDEPLGVFYTTVTAPSITGIGIVDSLQVSVID